MCLGWWRQLTLVVSLWIDSWWDCVSRISNLTHFVVFSPPVNFSQAMLQISRISFFWENRMNVFRRTSYNCYDLNLIHCTKSHNRIGKRSWSYHFDFLFKIFGSCMDLDLVYWLICQIKLNVYQKQLCSKFGKYLKDWHKWSLKEGQKLETRY